MCFLLFFGTGDRSDLVIRVISSVSLSSGSDRVHLVSPIAAACGCVSERSGGLVFMSRLLLFSCVTARSRSWAAFAGSGEGVEGVSVSVEMAIARGTNVLRGTGVVAVVERYEFEGDEERTDEGVEHEDKDQLVGGERSGYDGK